MNPLGRKKGSDAAPSTVESTAAAPAGVETEPRRTTAPKGRPTPKRDASRRRGPVAPAPMTMAEARRRRKELGGPKLSREERRAVRSERRSAMSERRERMMAGEEGYLLPRDRGPVREFARDYVDSRRNLLGLFMPSALGLLFLMLAMPPQLYAYTQPALLALIVLMAIDGILLGRRVNRLADEKFPGHTEGRWRLGFYAASRASQLRRMRAPRPRVNRGDDVG
ncbi:DUF3043 domain-containing protein [Mycobacterium sp. MYCO198283]|uniref:DUF3043 domain-containing protein n=1 Tax=Mycobacterium sp. MYCO198283 TaxID=2883505 RepID=UPI001E54E5EB|nr:DUF3043 domain-containing protein [Mycobacterium sp. MYCO198283]MCG5432686.1 DUF3043 domain-containing protein [Mycobacterium sp. MYCO198283]